MEKITIIRDFANINDNTAKWLETASRDEIGAALDFGAPIVRKINDAVSAQSGRGIVAQLDLNVPVYRGQVGEDFVEDILDRTFGGVTNMTKSAKSGDLTVMIKHRKIIAEVKNYTNPVPSSQVDKFQRDLHTTGACGGLFISLKTAITGVTTSFTVRFEHVDNKTIPCAYLVSSDESMIITATNMISSYITNLEYLNAELYSKDKIISNVYEIADHLDGVTKLRHELQNTVNDVTNQLMKASTGLTLIESGIRKNVDNVRGELFHTQIADIEPAIIELEKNQYFAKHSAQVKKYVGGVMSCVHTTLHKHDINGNTWKMSAKKCASTLGGVSFTFSVSAITVNIPRAKINGNMILEALNKFSKKVIVNDNLCIDLDESTYDWICEVIRSG